MDDVITLTLSDLEARIQAIYEEGKRDASRALVLWLKEQAEGEWKSDSRDEKAKADKFAWAARVLEERGAEWLHAEWVDHVHALRQDGVRIVLREVSRITDLAPEARDVVWTRLRALGNNIRAYSLFLMGPDPLK